MDLRWKTLAPKTAEAAPEKAAPPVRHPWGRVGQQAPTSGPWWTAAEFPDLGSYYEHDPARWIGIPLLQRAFEGGPPVRLGGWEGNLVVPSQQLLQTIEAALGTRLVRVQDGTNGNGSFWFVSETTMLIFTLAEQGRYASIKIVTVDEEVVKKSSLLLNRCVQPDDPAKGLVFALAKGMGGYQLTRLGAAGTPLERGNYMPEVIADYDHVVADLNTASPCGRLIILSGEPGTGKTFIVRSLLSAASRAAFILIPSHLVEGLSGPEILPALTGAKNEFNGPIVLIIEDADQCLVPRKSGNMNAISSLLNLGDGILGSILDVRILATTNAEKIEIDKATRRPGRLCRYMEVGTLSPAIATKALHRLTGRMPEPYSKTTTIAEVYQKARTMGWKPVEIVPARPDTKPFVL